MESEYDTFEEILNMMKAYAKGKGLKITEIQCWNSEVMGETRVSVCLKNPNHQWPSATTAQEKA